MRVRVCLRACVRVCAGACVCSAVEVLPGLAGIRAKAWAPWRRAMRAPRVGACASVCVYACVRALCASVCSCVCVCGNEFACLSLICKQFRKSKHLIKYCAAMAGACCIDIGCKTRFENLDFSFSRRNI